MNAASQQPKPPIFVVGAQRSGTTMLRLMLNAHPNIAVPFESGFIAEVFRELEAFGDLTQEANMSRLLERVASHPFVERGGLIVDNAEILAANPTSFGELIDVIFSAYARSKGKNRWGDKDPENVSEIDVLRSLFPNSLIIHIVRDGRDVAVSRRGVAWGSKNIVRLAQSWKWQVTLGHKMGLLLGPDYLQIFYEQLVSDPEPVLLRICEFVGEPYSPLMLAYSDTAESEMPSDSLVFHRNSVRPPDKKKIQMWRQKMSVADQAIFEAEAGDALAGFGYELQNHKRTFRVRLRSLYYSIVRRW